MGHCLRVGHINCAAALPCAFVQLKERSREKMEQLEINMISGHSGYLGQVLIMSQFSWDRERIFSDQCSSLNGSKEKERG